MEKLYIEIDDSLVDKFVEWINQFPNDKARIIEIKDIENNNTDNTSKKWALVAHEIADGTCTGKSEEIIKITKEIRENF